MNKISRKGFIKIAAAAAMSGVTAGALAACNAASGSASASTSGAAGQYIPGTYEGTAEGISSTVKVTMTLKNDSYTSFKDLYDDVTSVSDTLDVTVPGYSIGSTTPAGTRYTVTGTVEGSFDGTAEVKEANKSRKYHYTWKAEQIPEGKDNILKDDSDLKKIWYTVKVKKNDPENVTGTYKLPGRESNRIFLK